MDLDVVDNFCMNANKHLLEIAIRQAAIELSSEKWYVSSQCRLKNGQSNEFLAMLFVKLDGIITLLAQHMVKLKLIRIK